MSNQIFARGGRRLGIITRSRNVFNDTSNPPPSPSLQEVPTAPNSPEPTPIPIVSDWVCAICLEGANHDPNVVEHECGRHSYHISCVYDSRNTDMRCAQCRQPEDQDTGYATTEVHSTPPLSPLPSTPTLERPSFLQSRNIIPSFRRRFSMYRTICSQCRGDIAPQLTHASLLPCHHHIHDGCILNMILSHGFTSTGRVSCILCDE